MEEKYFSGSQLPKKTINEFSKKRPSQLNWFTCAELNFYITGTRAFLATREYHGHSLYSFSHSYPEENGNYEVEKVI